jgi:hypothetical protein
LYATQKETLQDLEKIVISSNKLLWCKETKLPGLQPAKRIKFVRHWKIAFVDILTKQLGAKGNDLKFVDGIFFDENCAPLSKDFHGEHLSPAFWQIYAIQLLWSDFKL